MRLRGVGALTIIVCCVVVAGCAGQLAQIAQDKPTALQDAPTIPQATPTAAKAEPTPPQAAVKPAQEAQRVDPLKDPRRMLIDGVNLCVTREAQTESLNRVDTETAAYAVVARCAGPLQEFKSYMAGHFPQNAPEFEDWWRTEEADALDFARKTITLARAQ